jgi:regulator of PEP synthase PpsR (kinase-PPPase family)
MGTPPIFIVSGGVGSSGEQVVRTALAQFRDAAVQVIIVPQVQQIPQVAEVVARAAEADGTIVHTLVDADLRHALVRLAREQNVKAIDLIGHLLTRLSAVLGQEPLGQPGLYRQLREAYFEREEAIEFAVTHDDGRRPHELDQAEIVLVGVSRSGKTPISMYLAVQGWKVANVPLVSDLDPPHELFAIDPGHVVGLTINPDQLVEHRRWRQRRLGLAGRTAYVDLPTLHEEVEAARQVYRRGGFAVVEITDKPIEESAQEIVTLIMRRARDRLD